MPQKINCETMAGWRNNYGKRSYLRDHDNGGSKRRNSSDEGNSYAPGPEDIVYHYLCLKSKIGSMTGRGGEMVKQLRVDTQAKIKIGESIPGSKEWVITIFSTSNKTHAFEDTGDNVCRAQDALFRVHERLDSKHWVTKAPMTELLKSQPALLVKVVKLYKVSIVKLVLIFTF